MSAFIERLHDAMHNVKSDPDCPVCANDLIDAWNAMSPAELQEAWDAWLDRNDRLEDADDWPV